MAHLGPMTLPMISAAQANGQVKLRSPMVIHLDSPVTQQISDSIRHAQAQGNKMETRWTKPVPHRSQIGVP